MTQRLYQDFLKKLKVKPVRKFRNKDGDNDEIVIAIPLKGGNGVFLQV